jgi:hypothetical protein
MARIRVASSTAVPLAVGSLEAEKLDIHLDVMSGDLFGISFG